LLQADFIILAYGYKFNMIPVYDYNLKPVSLLGEKTGHWVNQECELLDENNSSIRHLYAMGLATGFIPSGELGGEPSFQKQTNGFWYYQNALADFILKKIDEETPEVTS
jgi:hypothetical protein